MKLTVKRGSKQENENALNPCLRDQLVETQKFNRKEMPPQLSSPLGFLDSYRTFV